jgi:hypothetical protein
MRGEAGSGSPTLQRTSGVSGLVVLVFLECLVLLQAYLAYQDHFLTVTQMRAAGVMEGLPFLWHFGMWGDFLVISALAAYITGAYLARWRVRWIFTSLVIGFAAAGTLSFLYTLSDMPGAHVINHELTAAGKVHLLYMALALAIFIQFLFFTENVSLGLLRVVSALLFVHVFFGTHMVLGIVKLTRPLDWYPAQPLESRFGWYTLFAVGIGLAARNFGFSTILWIINQRYKTSEEYLKMLDKLCGAINISFFFGMIAIQWYRDANLVVLFLIAWLGLTYYLSRLSVWQELEIGKSLFPRRVPDPLKLKDRVTITVEVILFMSLYMALGWVAHCILVAALCMIIIACIDFNTRRWINNEMRRYLSDPDYSLPKDDPGYKALMEKRAVAEWFLFRLRHFPKEALRIAGCVAAFAIANYSYFSSVHDVTFAQYLVDGFWCAVHGDMHATGRSNMLAYAVLILTLIANEAVTARWRIERDRRLGRL